MLWNAGTDPKFVIPLLTQLNGIERLEHTSLAFPPSHLVWADRLDHSDLCETSHSLQMEFLKKSVFGKF